MLKRAVFTVEAAVIVPLSLTMIALLIGYCYFVHQVNWCTGAACEAAQKSVERKLVGKESSAGKKKMEERILEIPLSVGEIKTEAREGTRVTISFEGGIIQDYFGDLFGYDGSVSLNRYEPAKLKRLAFALKGMKE